MLNGSKEYGCMLIGSIGNDDYGKTIQSSLEKVGVTPVLDILNDQKSSRCAVGIHNKERCLMPQIRASTKLSTKFVEENMEIIKSAELLLVEGYYLIEQYEACVELSKKFRELGKKVAFTLSADFLVLNFCDRLKTLSNNSDIVFCNSDEARLFSGVKSDNLEDHAVAIHKMFDKHDRTLIITDGAEPVLITKFDYEGQALSCSVSAVVDKIEDADIVDTNGCGDSWVGGFLSQFIQGKSIEHCAKAGNWASSVIIKNVGCTYPDNTEIPKF